MATSESQNVEEEISQTRVSDDKLITYKKEHIIYKDLVRSAEIWENV